MPPQNCVACSVAVLFLASCNIGGAYVGVLHSGPLQMGLCFLTLPRALDRVALTCEADLPAERIREGPEVSGSQPPLAQRPRVFAEGVLGQPPAEAYEFQARFFALQKSGPDSRMQTVDFSLAQ